VEIPEVRYATTSDGASIAFQVVGSGPPDIVYVNSSYISNVELVWEWPPAASFLRGLAQRGRLILFDRRGAGLSDKVRADHLPTFEARMDEIRAVMDTARAERAILAGFEDGAALCFLFAATYPDRVAALLAYQGASRGCWAPDAKAPRGSLMSGSSTSNETGEPGVVYGPSRRRTRLGWATKVHPQLLAAGSPVDRFLRRSPSTGCGRTPTRDILPTIQAPTLVTYISSIHDVEGVAEESGTSRAGSPAPCRRDETTDVDPPSPSHPSIDSPARAEEAQFDRGARDHVHGHVGSSTKAAELGTVRGATSRSVTMRPSGRCSVGIEAPRSIPLATVRDLRWPRSGRPPRSFDRRGDPSAGIDVRAGIHTGEVETIDGKVGGSRLRSGPDRRLRGSRRFGLRPR
jgi:pimeloyl-ACP methyl ester carboxylesterase